MTDDPNNKVKKPTPFKVFSKGTPSYPVFKKETAFIKERRKKMTGATHEDPLKEYPTTQNGLVGLCFSGGGIRSATFNLGLLQALYKHGLLQKADYLSTVSGGGYIGSCLTSLLNSSKPDGFHSEAGANDGSPFWDKKYFPFGSPLEKEADQQEADGKEIPGDEPPEPEGSGESSGNNGAPGQTSDPTRETRDPSPGWQSAEKAPAVHLRYFSNYLTAEGGFIRKYIGPVLAITRGLLFNFLLIVPVIILMGAGLTLLYQIPTKPVPVLKKIVSIPINFNMTDLKLALEDQDIADSRYREYIYRYTQSLGTAGISQRIPVIKANPSRADLLRQLEAAKKKAHDKVMAQWKAMLTIPLAALLVMMLFAFGMMQKRRDIDQRFNFSRRFSVILFVGLVLGLIQVFGAAIVYWNHFNVPNMLTVVSLLTFLGPRLAQVGANKDKKPWVKIILSIVLMSLTPLILLYFTGWFVNFLRLNASGTALLPLLRGIPAPYGAVIQWVAIGLVLLYITNRWMNINIISLHNFYRDRLSRAFLIQADADKVSPHKPFQRVKPVDRAHLSDLYKDEHTVGPYTIINANLNLSKEIPDTNEKESPDANKKESPGKNKSGQQAGSENDASDRPRQDGVFRNCESFIFSKYWCGSNQTGYIDTNAYEGRDKHIDLGTAMAISGAAANIGMGQANTPTLRLLLGLLNIRLGYWAPNPKRPFSEYCRRLLGNTPGGWQAINEWIGRYSADRSFINLSDGGHFENLGVYEMLRRRCKYIIVGDAEADPQMKFQALAYIIRLARIDFGIEIEMDTSSLKPAKENSLSRQHCTVGVINYPKSAETGKEQGYLLYFKSSLTGDEPEHLHEYRVKHPSFPHQTTADQWFDEQQFEVYRELGFHVGHSTLKPIVETRNNPDVEELFVNIKEFWEPRSLANEKRFTQHSGELNRIMEIIKNDSNLAFMDDQIYPEWETLMSDVFRPRPPKFWLPFTSDELRSGFYVCNLMIQLMENVYLDLNLEFEHNHPANRGWMNLFKHWSWAGMFEVTWAISACTYGAKFQKFCAARLDLDIEKKVTLVEFWNSEDTEHANREDLLESVKPHLNDYEVNKLVQHIEDHKRLPHNGYAFKINLESQLVADAKKAFCFGFAMTSKDNEKTEIDFFRVQDHLRKMGLGRRALEELVKVIIDGKISATGAEQMDSIRERLSSIQLAQWAKDPAHLSAAVRRQFNSMLTSVKATVGAEIERK